MATKQEKDDAAKKAADEKLTAEARFTKERLQADLADLQRQGQQAEANVQRAQALVQEWQGKTSAIVGAISYCQSLLAAYGVEPVPQPDTKPVESKSQQRRKRVQREANGQAQASPAPASQVE